MNYTRNLLERKCVACGADEGVSRSRRKGNLQKSGRSRRSPVSATEWEPAG